MSDLFLGRFPVKRLIIVDDHRFLIEGIGDALPEKFDVRPVSLSRIESDAHLLAQQDVYLFPQPGDMIRKVFLVYYDKDIEINKNKN